ncbi:NCS2 family permease [Francisella sp. LA112445]|uniref:NCS2 family permease n=1 Tax=Francisella sp. LA112445 TaxID=1395624 RepID=UPI001788E21B|nr:NCS2 family permease [Francisella sp. LA112445]QIW09837.1 NCS2 family permease [Francisella sp. LA112445]
MNKLFGNEFTSYKVELIAGLSTFLTMIYIIIVNTKILSQTGMPANAIVTSTVMISALSSIAMGLYAKNPYAVAPAMGMNVFFAYTIVDIWHIPWQTALGTVFWSGVIFALLAIFNVRAKILDAIPVGVKNGIGAGIGVFVALVGFYNAGFIEKSPSSLLEIAPISVHTGIFIICLFLLIILTCRKVKTAMLIMIFVGCLLSLPFGRVIGTETVMEIPKHFFSMPDFSLFFSIDWLGSLKIATIPAIFSFLFINIFDSTGTIVGLASVANTLDEDGNPIRMRESLLVDSFSSLFSGLFGTSPSSVYVESAVGISIGGKSGLVAITVGVLFLPFLFLSPVVEMVPMFVVAPALVIIGSHMLSSVRFIEWDDLSQTIPAFLTIVLMPLTLSISQGIIWGMLSWLVISLATKKYNFNIITLAICFCCFLMMCESMSIF